MSPTRTFTTPTYTEVQVRKYFKRIGLPSHELASPISTTLDARTVSPHEQLRYLSVLQRYNLAAVPFENLDLHYSSHHTINIDPDHVFRKIVGKDAARAGKSLSDIGPGLATPPDDTEANNDRSSRESDTPLLHLSASSSGRGGYCMENNTLFSTVLRSLHYKVTTVGARVNEAVQPMAGNANWQGPKFDGWNHMLVLVDIANDTASALDRYLVDVGFGSAGSTRPIPLTQGIELPNVGRQTMRLIKSSVAQNTGDTQLWQYEHRNSDTEAWIPTYCFTETEFWREDYEMMSYFVSTHRCSWFTWYVVCVKMLLSETGDEVVGDVTMFEREMKRRVKGETEVLAVLRTEDDRVRVLKEVFGIELDDGQMMGIRGMRSELL